MPDLGFGAYPDDFERARKRISEGWGLAWAPDMQDWDLCNADARLLPQIPHALQEQLYSPAERFAIVELALASMDLRVEATGEFGVEWEALEKELVGNPDIYWAPIHYWAGPALKGEEGWPISSRMADIYRGLPEAWK